MSKIDFASEQVASNIFRTAIPMLVAQVFNLLYNIVDRIYIARIPEIGTVALGAVGLCFSLIIIVTAFTNLFGNGGAPLFSIELGKGSDDEAHKILCTSFSCLLITAATLTVLGEIFAAPLLRLVGARTDEVLSYSLPYFRIYLIGTIFQMTALGMNPFINAQGFPGIGMRTVVVGAISNTILDPLFIFVFGMGVRGAAIATVLSQVISCATAMSFLLGKKTAFRARLLTREEWRAGGKRALDIASLGTASFIMQATNGLVQIACNSVLMRTGGQLYISVMTIVSSVRQLLDMPVLAFSDGSSPMISYNYGARQPGHIRKIIRIVTTINMSYTAVVWLLITLFPAFFISIFSNDTAILTDAIPALHTYFFAFIFQALQYCGQTVFKALGKRNQAIFFSLLRKVVIVIPLTYILPLVFGLGTKGVFMAEPISNVIGGTACFGTMLAIVLPELKKMEQEG